MDYLQNVVLEIIAAKKKKTNLEMRTSIQRRNFITGEMK